MARRIGKRLLQVVFWLCCVTLLALATFALPVQTWRTGELPASDLPTSRPDAERPSRLWIDTDAACGHGRRSDPDDCLAVLNLVQSEEIRIAGVSTVFGNAALEVTDPTTRELASRLSAAGNPMPDVWRGSASPMTPQGAAPTEATSALADALRAGPLTIVALGPLTNVASTLRSQPELAGNVEQVIAVMGRRPGHLFHPSEGNGDGILFGHGPIFSDLNFRKDPAAVRFLLSTAVPVTLIPYEAARNVILTPEDLAGIANSGPAGAWVADSAAGWMNFWQESVGLDGFYPFDLVAAHYVLAPQSFRCSTAQARVEPGWAPDWLWMIDSAGLFVNVPKSGTDGRRVNYCHILSGNHSAHR
ncbi:nucleoside hydrolase [Roseibium salinum]|uniref:Nucleoside hydrolase n=1 Tax=Roseibium salinum TaxID=1604349 RepID=A0ABT3R9I8_9HYPH|nr:nucleoside hydrolase [Roseibium sp. DSM 29163]MCX2725758.1 nucleoside hydrolase [Roseibium sp. DSM 29163]